MYFKDIIESARLDIALEKYTKSGDLKPHIIYVGHKFHENQGMLHSLVFEQLKKHAIESAMITHLFMYKNYLMTKERMEKFFDLKRYTGEYDWVPRESINDNLENFVEELCHRKEQEHSSQPYFVSKLTKEEMKLVENRNKEYTETYFRGSFGSDRSLDISAEEIKLSESKSKYVNAQCYRTTSIVKNFELSKSYAKRHLKIFNFSHATEETERNGSNRVILKFIFFFLQRDAHLNARKVPKE